jgi:hypothetical protein
MIEYNLKIIKALNGWVIRDEAGDIILVHEDGGLEGAVAAALVTERLQGRAVKTLAIKEEPDIKQLDNILYEHSKFNVERQKLRAENMQLKEEMSRMSRSHVQTASAYQAAMQNQHGGYQAMNQGMGASLNASEHVYDANRFAHVMKEKL